MFKVMQILTIMMFAFCFSSWGERFEEPTFLPQYWGYDAQGNQCSVRMEIKRHLIRRNCYTVNLSYFSKSFEFKTIRKVACGDEVKKGTDKKAVAVSLGKRFGAVVTWKGSGRKLKPYAIKHIYPKVHECSQLVSQSEIAHVKKEVRVNDLERYDAGKTPSELNNEEQGFPVKTDEN